MSCHEGPSATETWTLDEIRLASVRTFSGRITCRGETFEEKLANNCTYKLVAEFAWRIRNRCYEPGEIGVERLLELEGRQGDGQLPS